MSNHQTQTTTRAQDATLDDTLEILRDLLAEARMDVERETPYQGSSLDAARFSESRILRAMDGIINALYPETEDQA